MASTVIVARAYHVPKQRSENAETSKASVAAAAAKSIANVVVTATTIEMVAPSVAELNAPQVQGDMIEQPNG